MCSPEAAALATAAQPAVIAPIAAAGMALGALMPKVPNPPGGEPAGRAPASQAERIPDQAGLRRQGANGGPAGAASTMLTGPGGVSPNLLSLGKNTLLGS